MHSADQALHVDSVHRMRRYDPFVLLQGEHQIKKVDRLLTMGRVRCTSYFDESVMDSLVVCGLADGNEGWVSADGSSRRCHRTGRNANSLDPVR